MLDIDPSMVYQKSIPLARTVSVQEVDDDTNIVRKRRDLDLTEQPNPEKKYLNLHLIVRTISSLQKPTKNAGFGNTLRSIVSRNSEDTFDQETTYEIIQNGFFLFISSVLSALIFWANKKINAVLCQVNLRGAETELQPLNTRGGQKQWK